MPSPRPALKSNHTAAAGEPNEEPTTSEKMAGEARAEKAKKPKGSPQLWPFAQLRRRERAQFFNPLRGIDISRLHELDAAESPGLADAADLYDLLAAIEDALRVVAVPNTDADADFDEWAAKADDRDLIGLFQWYMDRFAPGEAKPSSS